MSRFDEGDYVLDLYFGRDRRHAVVISPPALVNSTVQVLIEYADGHKRWADEAQLWRSSERSYARELAAYALGVPNEQV